VDTAGCILQGDVRTKVKTPGTGKNMVEEAVQTPLYPSPEFMPGLQHLPLLYFLKAPEAFLCLIRRVTF
jgi:hypothetical protein